MYYGRMKQSSTRGMFSLVFILCLGLQAQLCAQGTTRVSVRTGRTAQGNGESIQADLSWDGRFVAFASGATKLVPGDTNSATDVFIHDRQRGATYRASVSTAGVEADYSSLRPTISGDGQIIAFESSATNLVALDHNQRIDVFVHDVGSGFTERVSVSSTAIEGNGTSDRPAISADGRFVAFKSLASNLVLGDTNNASDIFVRDRVTGETSRVSVSSSGVQGNLDSGAPAISADGRYVAFESWASNLVPGDTNLELEIFRHDRLTGQTLRASVTYDGLEGNGRSESPAISADGRYVTFESRASNLVPGDTLGAIDVFVRDLIDANTVRVSVDSLGLQASGSSYDPVISADGSTVAFRSAAANLVPRDRNDWPDVFVHDRESRRTTRVSVDSAGGEVDWESEGAAISADGRHVAFESAAINLVPGDTNFTTDVFLHDRFRPSLTLTGACPGTVTIHMHGGSIGRHIGILTGWQGLHVQVVPPCIGMTLELTGITGRILATTSVSGVATVVTPLHVAACGLFVQAVDLETCKPSNLIRL